jgi:hypothetical protein
LNVAVASGFVSRREPKVTPRRFRFHVARPRRTFFTHFFHAASTVRSRHRNPRAFATMPAARADGRTPGMMRQLKLERAFLSRADGSARWEQGEALASPHP